MAKRKTFPCPYCGEEVPVGAFACPECGSDEKTGWSENTVYDGTDIPDDEDFDYDKTVAQEGLAKPQRTPRQIASILLAILLVILLLWLLR